MLYKKVCRAAGCGKFYETEVASSQYCTLKCRDGEKRRRRKARESELTRTEQTDNRFFADITNPSVDQLNRFAELIKDELTDNKPIRFSGTVPMWIPPQGVQMVQQQGVEPAEFLMTLKEESALDALLQR